MKGAYERALTYVGNADLSPYRVSRVGACQGLGSLA